MDIVNRHYMVSEIFSSIQGEGLHSGWPCVFLRFQGCNLWPSPDEPSKVCPYCDTKQLHYGKMMTLEDVVYRVMGERYSLGKKRHGTDVGLVITGGEPLLQLDDQLIWKLADLVEWIDIETNGTVAPMFDRNLIRGFAYVSCSPKTPRIVVEPDWFKVLIPAHYDLLAVCEEQYPNVPVYVQPVDPPDKDDDNDEEYDSNVGKCVNLVRERGYRLSVQIHKILDLP